MAFSLGGIPVRVRLTFLILALFLGSRESNPAKVAIWVGIVFVSVLVHELGHAVVSKAFGLAPQIELHGMGGTTSSHGAANVGRARSVAISLAGPFAGFFLAALVYGANRLGIVPKHDFAAFALWSALWVNVGWGIFNLFPIMPLDGGNVMRHVLEWLTKGRGERPARVVSIVLAGAIAAFAATGKNWWLLALGVMFVISNVQALQRQKQVAADTRLATAIEQANLALADHDGERAIALLSPALTPEVSDELRGIGARLLAYGMLLEGRWDDVVRVLTEERGRVPGEEIERFARTARELGRAEDAARIEALLVAPTPKLAG